MMRLSIVDEKAIRYDARKLAFLYPSIRASTFKNRTDKYYRNRSILAVEQVAKMFGCLLVPTSCLHYTRRNKARRVEILNHAYYIMRPDEMREIEIDKYMELAKEDTTHESSNDSGRREIRA